MICKKCGKNIADTSKFCGYCGNQVEQLSETNFLNPLEANLQQVPVQLESNNVVADSLENKNVTNNLDIINSTIEQDLNVSQQTENVLEQPIVSSNEQSSLITDNVVQQINYNNEEVKPLSLDSNVNVVDNNSIKQTAELNQNDNNKKNVNKIILIVSGVILAIVVLVLLFLAFNNSSNNSILTLQKTMNNFLEKGRSSGTIEANVLIESSTSDTINLSATTKYSKINDQYNFNFILNESMLFDEMNMYLTMKENYLTFYAKSYVIDMLGLSNSDEDIWTYYFLDLTDIIGSYEEADEELDLSKVLDSRHFKYINKTDNLNHYQLIIDNDLLDKINSSSSKGEGEQIDEYFNSVQGKLTEPYILDFYINDSNELIRISMDLSKYLTGSEISKMILSLTFSNFNNTFVEIPKDAINSQMDLETYISTYGSVDIPQGELDINSDLDNMDYTY